VSDKGQALGMVRLIACGLVFMAGCGWSCLAGHSRAPLQFGAPGTAPAGVKITRFCRGGARRSGFDWTRIKIGTFVAVAA